MKKTLYIIVALVAGCAVLGGCKKFEGDVTVPAYLQLDAIVVAEQGSEAPAPNEPGWYTYDINAVQLIAYFAGDGEETVIGTFELPCKVPVLREGPIEYLTVVPVVKQNGIAATRIQYPFLQTVDIKNLVLKADEVTDLDTVTVNYYPSSRIDEKFYENFELPKTDIGFSQDTVTWVTNDEAGARSGKGYGKIVTPAGTSTVYFEAEPTITMSDNTYLYLEMDYKTDVQLRVGMRGKPTSGGTEETAWAIMLYPRQEWGKIYINMGKLWSQFNLCSTFNLTFSTVDLNGTGGVTCIDNVKLISMK